MMTMFRRFLPGLLTAVTLLSGPAPFVATAQEFVPAPVTISKDKVKYKGKTYFSHVVQESQTLYSIAKAYGVSVQEIYDANPELSVLKKNAIILIPDKDAKGYEKPETPAVPESPSGVEAAPEAQVPAPADTVAYIEHIVKWNDTLAEKYGVSEQVIREVNHLEEGVALRKRQVLRIPPTGYQPAAPKPEQPSGTLAFNQEQVPPQTAAEPERQEVEDSLRFKNPFLGRLSAWQDSVLALPAVRTQDRVTLSVLLPFNAEDKVSENHIDFYSGLLLAVRDLSEKETIGVDLHVFDTGTGVTAQTVSRGDLVASDLILGPVSAANLNQALQLRGNHDDAVVVSPLDQKAGSLLQNGVSGFIQAPTSYDYQYKDLVNWLKDDYAVGDKILLISEQGGNRGDFGTKVTAALDRSGLPYKEFSYTILEGRSITDRLSAMLGKERPNRILIASEQEAFVNDVVRNLNVLTHQDYSITLYAPARFRNFETIDVESYHNLHLHVSTAYHIDYDHPDVARFLLEYRAFFQTEPTRFAFQGYDLASYLIRMVARYGRDNWQSMLVRCPESLLQMRMEFEAAGDGFENTGTRRIVYDSDFRIRTIR